MLCANDYGKCRTDNHIQDPLFDLNIDLDPKRLWIDALPSSLVALSFRDEIEEMPHLDDLLRMAEKVQGHFPNLRIVTFNSGSSLLHDVRLSLGLELPGWPVTRKTRDIVAAFKDNGITVLHLNYQATLNLWEFI